MVIGVGVVVALDSAPLVAAGLALAYSLAYVLGVGISFRRLQKTLPALALRPILALIGRTLIAAAPAGLAAWLILRILDADSQLLRALALAAAGVVAVVLYAVVAKLLQIREVTDIVGTVLRRGRRGGGSGGASGPRGGGPTDDGNPTGIVAEEAIEAEGAMATAETGGPEETTSMRTMTDEPFGYGDSTGVRTASSPSIGASADPTPVAGPTENADPMVTFAGASRMSGPASAPPAAPGPTDVLGGVPATPHPSAESPLDDVVDGADSLTPDASPSTLPRIMTSAGTVLGYRYRMEELLAESRPLGHLAGLRSRALPLRGGPPAGASRSRGSETSWRLPDAPRSPSTPVSCASSTRFTAMIPSSAPTSSASTRSAGPWRCCSATVRCRGWSRPGWSARSPTHCPACTDWASTTSGSTPTTSSSRLTGT